MTSGIFEHATRARGGGAVRITAVLAWFTSLVTTLTAFAHDLPQRLVLGPEAGISFNDDQWLVGALGRFEGTCVLACSRDLALSIHALAGLGGNYLTLRGSPRLEYALRFDEAGDVALLLGVGAGIRGYVPVGRFAEFCERTDLDACRGLRLGFEAGGGLRLWPVDLLAIVGTGQLPILSLTVSVPFPLWRSET